MAIYRQIQTSFWNDGFVMELTPEEKYFYFYLMTNPKTTQCGIFELPKRMAEMETGYSRDTVDKLLKRFIEYEKILYCEETKEIMIVNWMKYNFINSRNTMLCINKELRAVKNKEFVSRLHKICLRLNYVVESIFKGVVLPKEETELSKEKSDFREEGESFEEETEFSQEAKEMMKETEEAKAEEPADNGVKNNRENNKKNNEFNRGLEEAYEPLVEEETKKETYIQKEPLNKQKVINNNGDEKSQHKIKHCSGKNTMNKVLLKFNKNMRQATSDDIEKIKLFREKFQDEVIIQAIYKAVEYKAAHPAYIWSILKNWRSLGLLTMDKLEKHKNNNKSSSNGSCKASETNMCNADAYRYVD